MLLREMFSPIGAPQDNDQDINWLEDLKFFIDNDDKMLNQYFFPAVKKHKEHLGNPNAYKIYVKTVDNCLDRYCEKFNIEDRDEKFPQEKLIELAKLLATEQEEFIKRGDYED